MTNSQNNHNETDKTKVTISNEDFLVEIFGNDDEVKRPMIVSFKGNPRKGSKGKWKGEVWDRDFSNMPSKNNNFFSLASYHPNDKEEYHRQKKLFAELYLIMLDDIGSKVPFDRLALEPSYLLETSEENYQAGYLLKEPISDASTADQLMQAVMEANLSDPGASGPTTRLARLPVAVNGKSNPAFKCRMVRWNPEIKYSIEEIVTGLELDMTPIRKGHKKLSSENKYSHELFIDSPKENIVLKAIKNEGLYKQSLGDGKHDISCPWVHEHTDNVDDGAAYFAPNDSYPIGGYKCHHGHCADRNVRDLLEFLEIEVNDARMKPIIICAPGEIHNIVDFAEQKLASSGRYYQRGNLIVTIATDLSTNETVIRAVGLSALTGILCQIAEWQRYDKRSNCLVRIDPPQRVVSVLYDGLSYKHLPNIKGIAHQPYMRDDGSLMTNEGFDKPTGMFGIFEAQKFSIPESPSKEEAQCALNMISELLKEFSFAKESDKAAALSAILTAAIRPSLELAPMYHAKAPQISSGKSYLCQIIAAFASPRYSAPIGFPKEEEECQKVLLSEFLKAPAVIEFDNLTFDLLAHKTLCTALTAEYITGRILGVSKTTTVSTRSLLLSSGNNVGPVLDMTRRCITINLDPACENPAARTFENPNILSDLKAQREKYVSAALTIIRAWIVAGKPHADCQPLSSYTQWSELCRQPLLWLGLPDATENLFEVMNNDPDRERLGRLLEGWYQAFESTPQMVRNLVSFAEFSENGLDETLEDIAAEKGIINRRILGRWIARNANRVVNGKRLRKATGTYAAAAWFVETV